MLYILGGDKMQYASNIKRIDQLSRSVNDNSGFITTDTVEGLAADKGYGFVLSYYSTVLTPGSTMAIQIKTTLDATVAIKEEILLASAGDLLLQFYEDPTAMTSGTTPIAINNRQRRFYEDDPATYTAKTIVYDDPSAISGGTLLKTKYFSGGTVAGPNVISHMEGIGWQLAKGHNYVYKFINLDTTSTISYSFSIAIYELTTDRE